MSNIYDLVRDRLEEDDEDDLLDWISDGDGEDFDELEPPIEAATTFPGALFMSGLPKVGPDKQTKLMAVLSKPIDKYGSSEKYMPLNPDTNQTGGFMIVQYKSQESAEHALKTLNGFSLDKNHTFKVVPIDEFDMITSRSDEFRAQRTLNIIDRSEFRDWLLNTKFCEQLLLRYQQETEIYWHDTMAGQPVLCYGGQREKKDGKIWCDWRVQWSPNGSYLCTFHQQGIALWAGPEFEKKMRLPSPGVKYVDMSPNEEFLLTWNGSHPSEGDDQAVRIFRVLTGECVKKSRTPVVVPGGGDFPHFLWSHDGKFFAECNDTTISVRDTESFELIKDEEGKKRTLKYDGLHTFQWSPRENILAVWILEKNNNPARLVLVEVPSRKELASRSRTQVEATMHWQSEGDYLCLVVTKLSKTGKKGVTNLEIFRIRERNIPVDIVEVKDTVRGFYWETKGSRFAVLTTDDGGLSPKLLLYQLGKEKCENISVTNLPSNSFNNLFWGPDGQYFVCAAIGHGDLLFGGLTADNKLEINHKDEHFMLTDVEWDPSARYVMTAVTQPMQSSMGGFKYSMEAGYALWTFQGRLLFRQQKEKLFQVVWRPHPPSLLSAERQQHIRKNIKQFSKKYDALDEHAKEAARKAFKAERDEKTRDFQVILDRLLEHKEVMDEKTGWGEAWEDFTEAQRWETHESSIEQELGVTEDLISS
mmetsp:Transcript_54450/g.151705  ORF Transcript_54450/g.151705 Transcript_54450/m.151705 type:complete len:701 (+) Transcript_54450:79-2181(+)|eukprot:CAMPEP_0117526130 /NCGR_PEP_ID=MMETSP0784-20121206/36128_1 /TAXON_ID=39447 /ORGANISM="" /LENGTH=700 /DNA_ID=CAMNT_0005322351 /DNA_START=73 /DNA_END=2175 /DNA_ORIENTATION=-